MSKTIEERIKFLQKCASLYETSGDSTLSDVQYDREYAECKALMPDHPFFDEVGGIDEDHVWGTPFTHKYPMGSLNKDPNPDGFEKWFAKTFPDTHDLIAILDYKVDGVSLCLHYQDGKLIRVVTRGNGTIGIDITSVAAHVKGVLKKIDAKGYVEIKGECYKRLDDFRLNWSSEYANARNFTAGSLNLKLDDKHSEAEIIKRSLNFIAYEVRGVDFETETKKILFLDEMGFETLKNTMARIKCRDRSPADVARAVKNYMEKIDREKLPFMIDGVVFKLNNIKDGISMGVTNNRPKSSRAIKFPTDQQETILEGIAWQMGRTGKLIPVGLLKEVRLAGTNVKRVSLHNLKEMERLGIFKYKCTLVLEKAGDIIPRVVRKTKDGTGEQIKAPTRCPICDTSLEWDDTKTTVHCHNEICPAKIVKNIDHWFKKIGVKGIAEGIISKLTDDEKNSWNDPMVSSISDMYHLSNHRNELSESMGEKTTENIIKAIGSVKKLTLAQFIEALGLGRVGRTAADITALYPTISDIDNLTTEEIIKIDGFSNIKAELFLREWKAMRPEIDKILKYIEIADKKLDSKKLDGKKFCVTGSMSVGRKDIQKMIEDNGGVIKGSVGKGLDYLLAGEDCGGKKEKAEKLGIKIISEDEFNKMLR